jgi:hypothetical protein
MIKRTAPWIAFILLPVFIVNVIATSRFIDRQTSPLDKPLVIAALCYLVIAVLAYFIALLTESKPVR